MEEDERILREIQEIKQDLKGIRRIVQYQAEVQNRFLKEQAELKRENTQISQPVLETVHQEQKQAQIDEASVNTEQINLSPNIIPEQIQEPENNAAEIAEVLQEKEVPGELTQDIAQNEEKAKTPMQDEPTSQKVDFKQSAVNSQTKAKESNQPDELEFRIGGIWLNRIAIVLIVFGTAFFLKYAFDNNWVGPGVRVIIGVLFGVSFIVGGEIFQKKQYSIFAQGLTGGGIAILYFSIFAGYYFFRSQNIISQPVAMILMILITAAAVLLSTRYDSKSIALLGLLGGFLTPFLLATGENNYFALFTYILILNVGILSISYYKKWSFLTYVSFLLTQIILFTSMGSYFYKIKAMFFFSEAFFTAFFILYLLIPLVYAASKRDTVTAGQITLITFNTIFYTIAGFSMIGTVYPSFNGFFAILMALCFGAVGYWFKKMNPLEKSMHVLLFGTAITFITLAIPLQLYKYTVIDFISIGWVIESIILLYAAFKIGSSKMRKAAVIIMFVTAFKFFVFGILAGNFYDFAFKRYIPLLNKWSLEYLIVTSGLFSAWYLYRKNINGEAHVQIFIKNLFLIAANVFLFIEISMEISNYFYSLQQIGMFQRNEAYSDFAAMKGGFVSIAWSLYAGTFIYLGFVRKSVAMRTVAVYMIFLTLAKLIIFDTAFSFSFARYSKYMLVFNIGFISALVLIGVMFFACYYYKVYKDILSKSESGIFNILMMTAIIILGINITSENLRYFNFIGRGMNDRIAIQMQFGISSVWAIYSIIVIMIGIIKRYKPARIFAISLFGITILKVFLSDLSILTGVYRVLSFIILGFILLAVSFLYQKYKEIIIYDLPREREK